ncbi:neuronal acetylcholine receptor subunit alpha-7-like isoform X1 [Amphiura filiformis]|uniref:neuronal acetylcholine receptor subunit alpha-7-like isoform X1 n=1 Tax=Amphiura filiformis TaxID=82378 RepID=UPI003B212EAD
MMKQSNSKDTLGRSAIYIKREQNIPAKMRKYIIGWMRCLLLMWYFLPGTIASPPRGDHYNLTKELLADYGPTSPRPVVNSSTQIEVILDLIVQQVIDLNEREQTLKMSGFFSMIWHDDFLTWSTSEYPDISHLIIPTAGIWRPDIHLYENVEKDFESLKDVGAIVYPDGTLYWSTPIILHTSCRIDARLFPFDTQYCTLRFGSWSYNIKALNLVGSPSSKKSDFNKYFVENGIWKLVDVTIERILNDYGDDQGLYGLYPELIFTVVLKRRPMFHILSFILPCALLSILNLLAFILPTASGEKVSLGITNLLAVVLFQQLIGDTLPPSSESMPIISYYFAPMILLGCLSIVSGVVVSALYHQDNVKSVPEWLRKIFRLSSSAKSPTKGHREDGTDASTPLNVNNREFLNKKKCSCNTVPHGHEIPLVEYPDGHAKRVCEKEYLRDQLDDDNNEWQKMASKVENILLVIACVLTVSAITVTMALFITTN